ncbi:MAG: divalent-cation tolerance protein CutA [Sphingomonadaceae bacterium]
MSSLVSVYAVFASAEEAARIGRAMVEARLAACVNILGPCSSIYRWEGAIEEAQETPALFKTMAERADALVAAIAQAHGYAVPAIAVWPVAQTLPAYLAWAREATLD